MVKTNINNEISDTQYNNDANVDPLSGEVGSHPIGTGLGTFGGALAGAAIASTFGPVGTVAGAAAGALFGSVAGGIIGAYTGRDIAELVNPTEIDTYWSENYSMRPYVKSDADYQTYEPAYRYGYNARIKNKYARKNFNEVENELSRDWSNEKGNSYLGWNDAKEAVRDSYDYTDKLFHSRMKDRKKKN